ncbi:cytochrome P450 4g1-like [Zophobas morio]|uniref:cytochrome P450 4g1-like n=1 Tax=Zophobas morio TaxID=2755281 RepID=UPI003082CA96
MNLDRNQEVPHDYVLEESQIMFFVGTEISAAVLSSILLVLGMYPDVQKKIDEELNAIFGDSDRDPTLEDVNHMQYLDRVLKETMRLLPPLPFIMRYIDENVRLGPYVLPKDTRFIVPVAVVHRRPEFWPDPDKFDPDRFLPEEAEKRPVCSYIPFSYGARNCIAYKYGLLSIKIILSTFLRSYRITSSNYKSIQDIDLFIHVVAKPKNGYKITIEKKDKVVAIFFVVGTHAVHTSTTDNLSNTQNVVKLISGRYEVEICITVRRCLPMFSVTHHQGTAPHGPLIRPLINC